VPRGNPTKPAVIASARRARSNLVAHVSEGPVRASGSPRRASGAARDDGRLRSDGGMEAMKE